MDYSVSAYKLSFNKHDFISQVSGTRHGFLLFECVLSPIRELLIIPKVIRHYCSPLQLSSHAGHSCHSRVRLLVACLHKCMLNKVNTSGYSKVDREKLTRPQPYTKKIRQLRKFLNGRGGLFQGRT